MEPSAASSSRDTRPRLIRSTSSTVRRPGPVVGHGIGSSSTSYVSSTGEVVNLIGERGGRTGTSCALTAAKGVSGTGGTSSRGLVGVTGGGGVFGPPDLFLLAEALDVTVLERALMRGWRVREQLLLDVALLWMELDRKTAGRVRGPGSKTG